jgi:mRNA-degrading endonuclease toxin of MazEF toxin-antitoxin module
MNYKRGDIVIVKFPFVLIQRTEKQKGRPALIISNEKLKEGIRIYS